MDQGTMNSSVEPYGTNLISFRLSQQYSPNIFLAFAIGNTLNGILAFYSFGIALQFNLYQETTYILGILSVTFRILAILTIWIIWTTKGPAASAWIPFTTGSMLTAVQAAYPLLISAALALRLITVLMVGDCRLSELQNAVASFCNPYHNDGGIPLRLTIELMFNPILTAFLLRDTPSWSLVMSWMVAVAILVTFAIQLQSSDIAISTAAFVYCSVLIFLDSSRQYKELRGVLQQLQTALVENKQLARQEQALELRAMMGNMAHDLKTPLTSFLNGLECAREVIFSWEALEGPGGSGKGAYISAQSLPLSSRAHSNLSAIKKCLAGMKSTTNFMTMTINRCLDYTRTNAGVRLVPRLETAYLQALLEMPVKMMRDLMGERQIRLRPLDADICSHIITEKQWLLENLLCLLSNAVKYSYRGSVDVSVRLMHAPSDASSAAAAVSAVEAERDSCTHYPANARDLSGGLVPRESAHTSNGGNSGVAGESLRIEVMDEGIGLSEEAMQTLFNPFKQAQRLAGGTGLGLFSLAKRVEALQGQYGVCRRPDGAQGSLFWFTIPYRPDAHSAALSSESSEDSITMQSLSGWSDHGARDFAVSLTPSTPSSELYSHHFAQFARAPLTPKDPAPLSGFSLSQSQRHQHQHQLQLLSPAQHKALLLELPPRESAIAYRVLVVDDAPLIVRMTTMLLTRKGHVVTQAVNGAEGLDCILAGYEAETEDGAAPYDVVLMDLQMPIMDGPLAMRRLRAAEAAMLLSAAQTEEGKGAREEACAGGALRSAALVRPLPATPPSQPSGYHPGRSAEKGPLPQQEPGVGLRTGQRSAVAGIAESRLQNQGFDPRTGSSTSTSAQKSHQHVSVQEGDSDIETDADALGDIEWGMSKAKSTFAPLTGGSPEAPGAGASQPNEQLQSQQQSQRQQQPSSQPQSQRGCYHQFIIAVSANCDQETVQEALRSGADAFMTKPFTYDTFAALMKQQQQHSLAGTAEPHHG